MSIPKKANTSNDIPIHTIVDVAIVTPFRSWLSPVWGISLWKSRIYEKFFPAQVNDPSALMGTA